jgi:hypothetical protein
MMFDKEERIVASRGKCEAGCIAYDNGDIKHHKDCINYPGSLTEQLAQAKKEAVKEFVDKLKGLIGYAYYDGKNMNYLIDSKEYRKLLKQYEETK